MRDAALKKKKGIQIKNLGKLPLEDLSKDQLRKITGGEYKYFCNYPSAAKAETTNCDRLAVDIVKAAKPEIYLHVEIVVKSARLS